MDYYAAKKQRWHPPKNVDEPPRTMYCKQWEAMKADRTPHETDWQELTDFILPFVGQAQEGVQRRGNARIGRRTRKAPMIINNNSTMALRTFTSNMVSGLTSPSRQWVKMVLPDKDLMRHHSVKMWMHGLSLTVNHIFAISNYYQAQRSVYRDLGVYGTAPKILDEDHDTFMHCYNVPIGSYVIGTNDKGVVFKIMRELEYTVDALVDKFGYERCSQRVKDKYDRGDYNTVVPVVQCIDPNRLYQQDKMGIGGFRFASAYYETETPDHAEDLLGYKGYNEFPVTCPRWDLLNNDVYGIGPGIETLGDIKGLQILEMRKAQAIDKQVTPPTQGPPGLKTNRVSHIPGGHTSTSMSGNDGIRTLYEVRPDMISLSNEIQRHEMRIDRAFYKDILTAGLNIDKHNVKAAQINMIDEEKVMSFSPVLERLYDELLDVDVKRAVSIARRRGVVPPPPEEMRGQPLQVEYISPFAQMQKAVGIGSMERTIAMVGQLASMWPQAADNVDPDAVVEEYAEALGPPPKILLPRDKVQQIREAREQNMQAQQAREAMPEAVKAAKEASETNITDESMLKYLIGGSG
jgi:hypothetical protein